MFHYLLIFNLSISGMVFTFWKFSGLALFNVNTETFYYCGENFFVCGVVSIDLSGVVSNLKHISI
jgi:hypothetical protein